MRPAKTWRFPAAPAYVREARRAVREHAEASGCSEGDAVALAVSEAFTVALLHAPAATVEIVAFHDAGELQVHLRYDGPPEAGWNSDLVTLPFLVIPQLTRRFEIRRARDGTAELQMSFALAA